MIEQFFAIFIGMVDTMMVSGVGESAVSAISLVDSINVLLTQLFSAMATGGAVVAAQYLGRRDTGNACKAAKQLMYVSFFIAAALGLLSIVFCDPILRLVFGALDESTMAYCRTYLYLSALSYPALAIYNGGAALLRAMSNSRASMWTSFFMNLFNVFGNTMLIYVFKMEVFGAGLSTLFSRMLGAGIMLSLLLHRESAIHIERALHPEPDMPMIRRIFSQGIPNGLENSMFQVGKLMVASIVAMFSKSIIAANAISNNIASMINLPGSAIGLAIVAVVGQCVGAGLKDQARYYAGKLFMITSGLMVLTNVLLFFFARDVASLFELSPEGLDAAEEVLRFYAITCAIFWPPSFTLPNALRAAGDARFTMVVSMVCMWVFRIGASYVLVYGFHMGLLGIWIAMVLDWVVRGLCFSLRYRGDRWLERKVI